MFWDHHSSTKGVEHLCGPPGRPSVLKGEGEEDLIAVISGHHQDLGLGVLDQVHPVVGDRKVGSGFDLVGFRIPEEDVVGVDVVDRIESSGNQDPGSIGVGILDFSASRIRHVVQGQVQFSSPLLLVPVVNVNLETKKNENYLRSIFL